MSHTSLPNSDEVDQLLRNARLRDELEPFLDESVAMLESGGITTLEENEFLESILAWERAPIVPISQWFEPELILPPPDTLDDRQLSNLLWQTIFRLYAKRIVLEMTDHLSDRQLYCLLMRDILPSLEKKINPPRNWLNWHCLDTELEPDVWLRYYALAHERAEWAEEAGESIPPAETPLFRRDLPRRKPD